LDDIDMGDYEQLIRPASAFWRLRDGLTMAEKIILYRNWKYQVNINYSLYLCIVSRLNFNQSFPSTFIVITYRSFLL